MLEKTQTEPAEMKSAAAKTIAPVKKVRPRGNPDKAAERDRKNRKIEQMVAQYRETGDTKMKEEVLIANLSLISYIAERMAISLPQSVEVDDLKSLGVLGLIDAIEHYKPEKQVRFTSYAALRIKGSIIDGLRSLDWVPRSVRKKARDLEKTIHGLQAELGRPATGKELAEKLDVSLGEYQALLEEVSPITFLSLNDNVYDEEDQSIKLSDVIQDNSNYGPLSVLERQEIKQILINGINSLPEREKLVVALYYYESLTLKEIGEVMQISESRVCQIHTESMLRLRAKLRYSL
ncbi:MAG: FliA/WhiG family RNA polymerase sigma factor [Gemmatimonadota bacterium]|nr:FliA/WhiG family RNA polymerase sigma factor [Gemmatimonadota bacterium]